MPITRLSSPKNNTRDIENTGYINWLPNPRAIEYQVQLSNSDDFSTTIIDTIVKTQMVNYKNLDYDAKYFWRVKALSTYSKREWSEIWNFSTYSKTLTVKLISPENDMLHISLDGKFQWEKLSNVEYYSLQVDTNPQFLNPIIDKTNVIDDYFDYKDFVNHTTYYWRVRFYAQGKYGNWSDVWEFTTIPKTILASPGLNGPDNEQVCSPNSINFGWESVENATNYMFSLSEEPDFRSIFLKIPSISDNKIDISNLTFNTKYYWRVAAYSQDAQSRWSSVKNFITELEPPEIISPSNNTANHSFDGYLEWSGSSDVTLYHLQLSKDYDFSSLLLNYEFIYDYFYQYHLEPSTEYYWRVKAKTVNSYSQWSEVSRFSTGTFSDLPSDNQGYSFTIFPNPATEFLKLGNDLYIGEEYIIYSVDGSKLNQGIIENNIIDVRNLTAGLYILNIGNEFKYFIIER